jgi:hypothetical protein
MWCISYKNNAPEKCVDVKIYLFYCYTYKPCNLKTNYYFYLEVIIVSFKKFKCVCSYLYNFIFRTLFYVILIKGFTFLMFCIRLVKGTVN